MENYPLENPLPPRAKLPSESPEEKTASKKRSGEALISGEKIGLLKRKIDNIVAEIEKLNPEKINPEWVFKNCSSEYNIIRKKFRTIEGKINWQLFVDLLPSDIKGKWSYEEHRD